MKHPISGTDTDASAEDIADLWPEMWANMGGLPEDEPDRRTVAAWFAAGECPPERLADANEQLGALLGWTIFGRLLPPEVKAEFDDPDVALPVTIGGITADDRLSFKTLLNGRSVEGECDIAELAYEWRLLDEGKRPPFPVSTILRAWKDRPTPVDPERRPTKILAEPLRYARPTQGILPIKGLDVPVLGQQPGRQAALPGLEQTPGAVVPVLPLHIAEYSKAGRGAAITPRLWFGFQMALPREIRDGREARLNFTLRELVSWLWPNGWERRHDLPKLAQGLHDLNQLGIVYERVKWLLVRPVKTPTWETRLDDSLRVDVTSLPGSDRGPMIDTVRLWQLGTRAGAPWRAWIRLAYLWDAAKRDNGGFRIYATRPEVLRGPDGVILNAAGNPVATPDGRPATNWNHPSAVRTGRQERNPQADRLPILDNRDLAHLGFDDNESKQGTLRSRARETRRWLREMESLGAVALEWKDENVRVLEPWPGDGAGDGILTPPNPVTADA